MSAPRDWRRLFRATDAPWHISFALHIATGMVAGTAVCLLFTGPIAAVFGGLCAGLTAGISARVPGRVAGFAATLAAAAILIAASLGVVTSPVPWAAALALGVVIFVASLLAGTGPLGGALGLVASFAFVLTASIRILRHDEAGRTGGLLLTVLCGVLIGLVLALLSGLVRAKGRQSLPPKQPESLGAQLARSVRTRDESFHDGIRRAVPLSLSVLMFGVIGGQDAYWIFFATFAILLPTGKPPLAITVTRVVGTVLGVVATGLLALFLPSLVLAALAAAALLTGVACQERLPVVGAALNAFGAIMIIGLPHGAVTEWAAHRLVDTLIGAAIAVAAVLLLWPRDAPTPDRAISGPDQTT
ncbi:FUSC family protein [Microbacterium sp.]|uniref:FUSC family protein n=1 Tax=Microbacterium sp. TaxID=51671 RepID=UPI003221A573